jgi:hypothetical protein
MSALGGLLCRAQQAGSVRCDIDTGDVIALVTGCLAGNPIRRSRPRETA